MLNRSPNKKEKQQQSLTARAKWIQTLGLPPKESVTALARVERLAASNTMMQRQEKEMVQEKERAKASVIPSVSAIPVQDLVVDLQIEKPVSQEEQVPQVRLTVMLVSAARRASSHLHAFQAWQVLSKRQM